MKPLRIYLGPNPYSEKPVVFYQISYQKPELINPEVCRQRLEECFPESLQDCPFTGDLLPAQALTLMTAHFARFLLNQRRGYIQAAGASPVSPNVFNFWVGYHLPELTIKAVELSFDVVQSITTKDWLVKKSAIDQKVEQLLQLCRVHHPDYLARILMMASAADNLPVMSLSGSKRHWVYGWGCHSKRFFEAASLTDSRHGSLITSDKTATVSYLAGLGVPVSQHIAVKDIDGAIKASEQFDWPLVVKPMDRGQGQGVTVGINSRSELEEAFQFARKFSAKPIIIERFIPGDDHRLLVIRGKLIAATKREPASIVGNGSATIAELINELNLSRHKDRMKRRYLKQISLSDHVVLKYLESRGLSLSSQLALGEKVYLRSNANVSTGGSAFNVLDQVNPDIKAMAEMIAKNFDIEALGIDYVTEDISQSWHDVIGGVIEINTTPGLDLHAVDGLSEVELGRAVLGEGIGRIPTAVVVAPLNMQRELMDVYANSQSLSDGYVLVGPDYILQGNIKLARIEKLAHRQIDKVLQNRTVESLIGFISPEEVNHYGFLLERCDIAILNYPHLRHDEIFKVADSVSDELVDKRFYPDEEGTQCNVDTIKALLESFIKQPPQSKQPEADKGVSQPKLQARDVELTILKSAKLTDGPALFVMMKDEEYFCPFFFEHYRKLGVENFVVYDDHSTDGTLDYLMSQPDCMVVTSDYFYRHLMPNGRSFHHHIRNIIPEALGENRWVVNVDADEFLILPEEFNSITELYEWLDSKGYTCVDAGMIDFYPQYLSQRNYSFDTSPFEACPYFDIDKAYKRPIKEGDSFSKVSGGIRCRLQDMLEEEFPNDHARIYEGRGYKMAATWKHPIIKTGTNTYFLNSHSVNRMPPPDIELALAHFKFTPSLDDTIDHAVINNNYYHGSIEYQFLKAAIERFDTRDLVNESSRRFEGASSLQKAGFIRFEGS